MKLAVCALAPVLAVAVLRAAGPIEWSSSAKLTPGDFQGKAPAASDHAAHSWVALDVAWECRDGKASSSIRAVFDPSQSWWRSTAPSMWGGVEEGLSRTQLDNRRTAAERDRDLLLHEQLHFDLTELAARKIRKTLDDLKTRCTTPAGSEGYADAIAAIEREWTAEQGRYDRETGHGTNPVVQRRWESRVRQELAR